jgi:dipeptidyl aminopeptidase/acylaminoacyl peptidase
MKPFSAVALVCGLGASASLLAQGGRAMTTEDLIGAVRVADPQLSPDGTRVAYMRTTTDLASGKRNADIWVVGADGAGRKALVEGDKSENTPRWSPDGRRIAFILNLDFRTETPVTDVQPIRWRLEAESDYLDLGVLAALLPIDPVLPVSGHGAVDAVVELSDNRLACL